MAIEFSRTEQYTTQAPVLESAKNLVSGTAALLLE